MPERRGTAVFCLFDLTLYVGDGFGACLCLCAAILCMCTWTGMARRLYLYKIATYIHTNTEFSARAPPHHAELSLMYLLTPRMWLWGWVNEAECACDGFGFYGFGQI